MRNPEDRPGPLVTCTGNTGRLPVLTGELVPVDWHGLPVQVGDQRHRPVLWVPHSAPYFCDDYDSMIIIVDCSYEEF